MSDEPTSAPPEVAPPDREDLKAGLRAALLQCANAREQKRLQYARDAAARISITDILNTMLAYNYVDLVNGVYSVAVETDGGPIAFDVRPARGPGVEATVLIITPKAVL